MAIASGLPCVDYLAPNFYSSTSSYLHDGELRYSPTSAFNNELFTDYMSNKQQKSVFEQQVPFLEFTRLSLEDTTFDFTTPSSPKTGHQKQSNNSNNEEFRTEFEKMRYVLNNKTPTKSEEIKPFSVNNSSCCKCPSSSSTTYEDNEEDLKSFDSGIALSESEDDEELGSIFPRDSSPSRNKLSCRGSAMTTRRRLNDARHFKSISLPNFGGSLGEKEEEEVSDSEMELTQIIATPRTPSTRKPRTTCSSRRQSSAFSIIGGVIGSNRKRRTSTSVAGVPQAGNGVPDIEEQLGSLTKRPYIDAEKMHRSAMVQNNNRPSLRKVRRNLLEKDLFVPILQ